MYEDEAKTKACCGPSGTGAGHDFLWNVRDERLEPVLGPRTCIGSACMAWRSVGNDKFRDRATGRISDSDLTGNGDWIRSGYCGLAGAPR